MHRRWIVVLALTGTLGACATTPVTTDVTPAATPTATPVTTPTAVVPRSGITAGPSSSAFPVQGQDMRLVRVGSGEVALQFEFVNGTGAPLTPDVLGIDQIERALMLVDLPRATAYQVLTADGLAGRISDSNGDVVPPNGSATLTAVFTAPPADVTRMTVLVDGLLPVDVPVQPAGAPALVDDPVLRPAGTSDPLVTPLLCPTEGPPDATGTPAVAIRLSSDVLFAFGSAELSASALTAIKAVGGQIGGSGGTVTIEGHTDAIGTDAANQVLSEQRAAAVRSALEAELGGSFTYRTTGFGEARPVAPNTRPDGSDDPDGRAQNRRVEIRTGDAAPAPAATLATRPLTDDLAKAGLTAEVRDLQRRGGHLLAQVVVTNPTGSTIPLDRGSGLTPDQAEPLGLTLGDRTTQRRHEMCRIPSRQYAFFRLGNPGNEYTPDGSGSVPAGAAVTFWAFFAPPAPRVDTLDVEVGGFGRSIPTSLRA